MSNLERFVRPLSNWFINASSALILVIFVISVIDIIGSKFFNWPFPGSVELIGFLMAVMISLAVSLTQLLGRHIKVEFFTDRLPKLAIALIDAIVSLILFCFFIVLIWQLFLYGRFIQGSGEYSQTLRLPFHYFIYIMAIGFVPACLVFLSEFLHRIKEAKRQ